MHDSPFAEHDAAGRAAWPGVELDADRFARHLDALASGGSLALDRAGDLYLACACAHRVPGAVEAFERTHRRDLARAVARVDASAAFVADAVQIARERLLVPRGNELPRIAAYAGRAPLRAWLAAIAARVALTLRRRKSDAPHDSLASCTGAITDATPELALLRARFKAPFEQAIRDGVARLTSRDRALLRLHLVERMSIDALARSYGVNRATTARWLVAARVALLDETRRILCGSHRVTPSEFDSIAKALQGDLDVSFAALARA